MFVFNPSMLKKIFFIGLPFAAEQMFFNGGKILDPDIHCKARYIRDRHKRDLRLDNRRDPDSLKRALPYHCDGCRTMHGAARHRRRPKFIRSFILLSSAAFAVMGLDCSAGVSSACLAVSTRQKQLCRTFLQSALSIRLPRFPCGR